MKVDGDQKGQRPQQQQGKKGADEDKRRFADIMERQRAPGGHRAGDERGRKLRDGTVQREQREKDGRVFERRAPAEGAEGDERRSAKEAGEAKPAERSTGQRPVASVGDGGERSEMAMGAVEDARGLTDQGRDVGAAQESERAQRAEPPMPQVAKEIVQAVRVGEDAQARKVVFLDVTVPGRGDVRIRLRRDGGGMEVRMRADNDALARSLQQGVGQLREEAAKKDLQFTSVQVVR